MTYDGYLAVARIARTHGLKGEVAVEPLTAASLSLLDGVEVWLVPPPAETRNLTVNRVRQGPRGLLMRFDEIWSIDAASKLVGREVLAPASLVGDAASADEDGPDLEGYAVHDEAHGDLGTIHETIITGANDVWVVQGPLGEVLIPVIDDVVCAIDDLERRIDVRLLPGLLPERADR